MALHDLTVKTKWGGLPALDLGSSGEACSQETVHLFIVDLKIMKNIFPNIRLPMLHWSKGTRGCFHMLNLVYSVLVLWDCSDQWFCILSQHSRNRKCLMPEKEQQNRQSWNESDTKTDCSHNKEKNPHIQPDMSEIWGLPMEPLGNRDQTAAFWLAIGKSKLEFIKLGTYLK